MMESKVLFKKRFQAHLKETIRYFQYILNGHIAIAILFLIGAGAVFYQQFLAHLPANFPTDWIVSLLFSLVALHNPIQNLLKKADLVFLLPAEKRLTTYFNYTLLYSFLTQFYLVALVIAIFAPLYQVSYSNKSYFSLVLILILFKCWHFLMSWWMLRVRDKAVHWQDKAIRFLLQFLIFYCFINTHLLVALLFTVGLFGYLFYGYRFSHRNALAWDLLIEKDQQRMQAFYRLASMFTDVPHFKATIKKRALLIKWLTGKIPFKQKNTYRFLYQITFIRSADYFGLYVRLTIIAIFLLAYFNQTVIILGLVFLFLFLTGVQLISIWYHHRTNIWKELYPVNYSDRQEAIVKLIEQLLFGQLSLFVITVLLAGEGWQALLTALLGFAFIISFSKIYLVDKIKQ
ncbi:ABC transporter permease [Amphibacillus sp. MSJ-3]|uniref:ABC transporter permease n=1 Tax=Amphibacillus sp. MSJ-3 TaxID=2841505 RepID=UPI001C0F0604|nr:ABC transporter permease [Amphibacillus sp. MSJ-3]MBU5594009.1 ABC transporter permease [Amphibacillus sp. MSJ-3]